MYDVIEKATEASINPAPKNDKIEARLRNIESKSLLLDKCVHYMLFDKALKGNILCYYGLISSVISQVL